MQNQLVVAAENGNLAEVQRLLGFDRWIARADIGGRGGQTPLMRAAGRGYLGVVNALLSVEIVDVNRKNDNGRTALAKAV